MQTTIKQDMWTGEIFYINPDTSERINNNYETGKHVDYQEGDGIVGSLASVAKKVTSKLTGKVAKDVAKKALSKAAEKGVERIGEKTGQLIGERIYDKFSKKPSKENKGEQIVELLKSHPDNTELQTNTEIQRDMKQESLSQEFDKLILM